MCDYVVIRAPKGRPLPLAEVGARLSALGLRHDGGGTWLTGEETADLLVNAEVDASGRFAVAADDLVVSLDVTLWCPHSGRTVRWPDEATHQAQRRLLDTVARTLGWAVVDQDDPDH
ncbi:MULTISPECIES: hypothetical protein [Saccharothrix]|uniref:hypothetical protein n=1 Tax=Saccharothrix TaxID=2071 RepID=UPI00093F8E91|nr:hypothetical protein [Saccharothrix sp. CB00851]OKI37924.1 hypothetical protein A6A25_17490 [Saccharothrix sp. CB00851]